MVIPAGTATIAEMIAAAKASVRSDLGIVPKFSSRTTTARNASGAAISKKASCLNTP